VPLDIIGWSRGAFESVKLANLVSKGLSDGASKRPNHNVHPWIRFVGLISPVGMMGPFQGAAWETSLPLGVGYLAQALDNQPSSWIFPETTMAAATGTIQAVHDRFPFSHPDIGTAPEDLTFLIDQATQDGVPV